MNYDDWDDAMLEVKDEIEYLLLDCDKASGRIYEKIDAITEILDEAEETGDLSLEQREQISDWIKEEYDCDYEF